MSFNCSSLTEKQINIIKYVQNDEQNWMLLFGFILIINYFITDTVYGYTPLYILYRRLSGFMETGHPIVCYLFACGLGLFLSSYIPVLNTFIVITGVLNMMRLRGNGSIVWPER